MKKLKFNFKEKFKNKNINLKKSILIFEEYNISIPYRSRLALTAFSGICCLNFSSSVGTDYATSSVFRLTSSVFRLTSSVPLL